MGEQGDEMTKKNRIFAIIFTTVVLCMGVFFSKGPVLYPDSLEYMVQAKYLPALYPTLLYGLHMLFGDAYLWITVLLQTVLAIGSIIWLTEILVQLFQVQNRIIEFFILLMLVGTFFVDNLNLMDGYETCNLWILTEGICYPLFFIFVGLSIRLLKNCNIHNLLALLMICGLLTLCRQQMMACFAMAILYIVYLTLFRKIAKKDIIRTILPTALTIIVVFGIQQFYQSLDTEKQPFYQQSELSHLLFFANQEDGENLEDLGERELYLDIFNNIQEQKLSYEDAEKTIAGIGNAYLYNFAEIQKVYYSVLFEYAATQTSDRVEQDALVYEIMTDYIEVLKPHTGQWIKTVLIQLPIIFSVSIFTYQSSFSTLCMAYSTLMIIIYLMLILYRILRDHAIDSISLYAGFILIYIVGTGLASTYAIRSLGRYMFYTCGLFYIAYLLLIIDIYKMVKRK